ncbi:MAG TPA: NAD(P)-dependent oxidoreductase [Thermoplasmatales archaeon]|nr:NAD(P)-dependent oxidoreductase [Thermoplasmatales archaeon]
MKRLLITGSKGLIGSILMKRLKDEFELIGIDIKEIDDGKRHFKVDISDFKQLCNVFEKIDRIDYIIHLAADARVNADWQSILKNNIIGTKNIYECARIYKVKKVIFASSNHVTGGYEGIPPRLHKLKNPPLIKVTDPIRPDSDYATSNLNLPVSRLKGDIGKANTSL